MTYLKKIGQKLVVIPLTALVSLQVHAIDDAAIAAAYTAASTSVNSATSSYIGLVAIIIGVGLVISMFKKS